MNEIRETVIEHMEGDDWVGITAAEPWSKRRLLKLLKNSAEFEPKFELKFEPKLGIIAENKDGSIYARIPLSWVRIAPPRKSTMTEEQKKAAAERLRALRKV